MPYMFTKCVTKPCCSSDWLIHFLINRHPHRGTNRNQPKAPTYYQNTASSTYQKKRILIIGSSILKRNIEVYEKALKFALNQDLGYMAYEENCPSII